MDWPYFLTEKRAGDILVTERKEPVMFPSMNTIATGSRIRFVSSSDPYTTLSYGDEGTVELVDSLGTVHVQWDNGSTLGMIPGEDRFALI